jgi:flagellar hook-length control protein FliK
MEAFLGFLKSVERPDTLSIDQANNIRQMMRSMLMSQSFKGSPHFNRVLSLLQSMGDQEIDQNFLQTNPAIQALRSGPASTKAILGNGNQGQGGSNGSGQGTADGSGRGMGGMFDGQLKSAETSAGKARSAGLTSRLSDSVLKQVAEKMIYQANNNQHRLRLQLTPPELGKLNINMVVKANVVHATIIADNPQVKAALEDQMAQLKDNLAKQGLDLEHFDISYNDQQRQAENWKEERRLWDFKGDSESESGSDPESEEENERQPMLGKRRGGVDRHV